MARRAIATEAKKARGNAGKRKLQENLKPVMAGPAPPDWLTPEWLKKNQNLGLHELAIAVWNTQIGERIRLGLHTVLDVNEFARACTFQALFIKTWWHLGKGDFFKELTKKPTLLAMLADEQKVLHPIELESGGTPKARNSLFAGPTVSDPEAEKERRYF